MQKRLEGEEVSAELRWSLRRQCFVLLRGGFWDMNYADYMVRSYTALLMLMLTFSSADYIVRSYTALLMFIQTTYKTFWAGIDKAVDVHIARFAHSVPQQCGGLLVAWGVTSMHAVRRVCEANDRTHYGGLCGIWSLDYMVLGHKKWSGPIFFWRCFSYWYFRRGI